MNEVAADVVFNVHDGVYHVICVPFGHASVIEGKAAGNDNPLDETKNDCVEVVIISIAVSFNLVQNVIREQEPVKRVDIGY